MLGVQKKSNTDWPSCGCKDSSGVLLQSKEFHYLQILTCLIWTRQKSMHIMDVPRGSKEVKHTTRWVKATKVKAQWYSLLHVWFPFLAAPPWGMSADPSSILDTSFSATHCCPATDPIPEVSLRWPFPVLQSHLCCECRFHPELCTCYSIPDSCSPQKSWDTLQKQLSLSSNRVPHPQPKGSFCFKTKSKMCYPAQ